MDVLHHSPEYWNALRAFVVRVDFYLLLEGVTARKVTECSMP
jgi:hypothetical protein